MGYLISILGFLLIIGILIVVHEWGHFLLGRWAGARIESFSIGFGPALYSFKDRYGTRFILAPIPLGGYVKFYGENPLSYAPPVPGAFYALPVYKRFLIVLAGPGMNLLLAFLCAPLLYWLGVPEPAFLHRPPEVGALARNAPEGLPPPPFSIVSLNGKSVATWEELYNLASRPSHKEIVLEVQLRSGAITSFSLPPTSSLEDLFYPSLPLEIHRVIPGMPAEKAGFMKGDRIVKMNGEPLDNWVLFTQKLEAYEQNPAQPRPLTLTIIREGKELELTVTPQYDEKRKQFLIGIERQEERIKHAYPFSQSLVKGAVKVVGIVSMTLEALYELVAHKKGLDQLGGPIAIAQGVFLAYEREELYGLLFYMIFLSIQLAIFNLLPIPMLDGGHVILLGLEGLFRKPLPQWFLMGFQWLGIAFLLLLFLFVTKLDLSRILGGS